MRSLVLSLYDGEDFCGADRSIYISSLTLTLSIHFLWQEISHSVSCMHLHSIHYYELNYKFIHEYVSSFLALKKVDYFFKTVPSLSVALDCFLSCLLCCTFTISELLFNLPTLLYLHYLWVVAWAPFSVVPSLSVGCYLSSLLCCTFTICGLMCLSSLLCFWAVLLRNVSLSML